MNKELLWFNYRTEKYDFITTPEDFSDYIPQEPSAQGLYQVLTAQGDKPIDAADEVLKLCVGKS